MEGIPHAPTKNDKDPKRYPTTIEKNNIKKL